MSKLSQVIDVIEDKCVNCHACISVCPVKFCNDGSGDAVVINGDACIGCGECIRACTTHKARVGIDDFDAFTEGLKKKEKIIAITAPAVVANFPDAYLNLNGLLKDMGVEANFDVSFGAELTVKSYLTHIKNSDRKVTIAQPCPAIVSYIQIYQPELLEYLAPADSPMLHTIKMIKEYYPEYRNHKVAVISPCYAKKREFEETGYGDYNVTFKSINDYIEENRINLKNYQALDYDNPPAERAVVFSSPGGLLTTVKREVPDIEAVTRKIEGPEHVYEYLNKLPEVIKKGDAPFLIDCLNCPMGCNGGPATMNLHESQDTIERRIEKRSQKMQDNYSAWGPFKKKTNKRKLSKVISKFWRQGLYDRSYANLNAFGEYKLPNANELKDIYKSMHKYSDKDIVNCRSCGYNDCELMGVAIFNGLNKPENCHFYQYTEIELEQEEIKKQKATTENVAMLVYELLEKSKSFMNDSNDKLSDISETVDQLEETNLAVVERMEESTNESIESEKLLEEINKRVNQTAETISQLDGIVESIEHITSQINLLALNASIEAARAGDAGRGFTVVAAEVGKLADESKKEAEKIAPFSAELKAEYANISQMIGGAVSKFEKLVENSTEVMSSTEEISSATSEINSNIKASADHYKHLSEIEFKKMDEVKSVIDEIVG